MTTELAPQETCMGRAPLGSEPISTKVAYFKIVNGGTPNQTRIPMEYDPGTRTSRAIQLTSPKPQQPPP
ncbi:hypothetical protein HYU95_00530 [Candidatus Daviesbacteria bacterium]|nr:hypothetical protein [Candidatus Daviesbacteria bacterium]